MTQDAFRPSDELIERALARRAPRGPDTELLRHIVATAGGTPQGRRWWPLGLPGMGEPARRLVWIAIVLILMAAFALGTIIAGGPRRAALVIDPLPQASEAAPSPRPAIDPNAPVAVEEVASDAFRPDVTYTSRTFQPRLTFRLRGTLGTGTYLVPSPDTSARTLVIRYRGRVGEEVRILRPSAVDCGTPTEHPDAATLAAAILEKPGMAHVKDLGSNPYRSESAGPENLIFGAYPKRVIKIDGTGRTFDAGVSDPDRCRLLMEPGSDDPTIEIRGDMAALLIFTDIDGELVVIRVSDRGYDAPTGTAYMTRDYLVDPAALTASPLPVYLGDIFDLETVRRPSDPVSASPSPSPTPTSAAFQPRPSPWPLIAIEHGAFAASPGTTYTSDVFAPRVTFEIDAAAPGARGSGEWCPGPYSSARTIVLRHAKGCVQELDILRPYAVDCGPGGAHPDADALAAAVLERLGAAARDAGASPAEGTLPADLLDGEYHRRVIQILGDGSPFDATVSDPDGCRLLQESGSDDPVIEIRGDITSTLVLLDIRGELIIVRASLGGHDAASGRDAFERGYASGGAAELLHLLQVNHHLRFD